MTHPSHLARAYSVAKRRHVASCAAALLLTAGALLSAQASQVAGNGISSVITKTPPPRASTKAAPHAAKPATRAASTQSRSNAGAKS